MSHADPFHALSAGARRTLEAFAVQAERYGEAVRGLCARGEVVHTQHGRLGTAPPPETTREPLSDPDAPPERLDVLALLTGPDVACEEVPSTHPNELQVRIVRRPPPAGEASGDAFGGMRGADLTFRREPVELLRAVLQPPPFTGLVALAVASVETEVLFAYVNGVPLPSTMRMRLRSRGVGRFRFDEESVTTYRYEPCGPPAADETAASTGAPAPDGPGLR